MNSVPQVSKWIITATVMLPTLIEIMDINITNVSLHTIQGSLSADASESTWIVTSYLVANAIIIPMSGWLAKVFGRKRYLMFSITVFTIASVLCGTATSLTQLIAYRVLQGLGGGALQPMSQAILMESFPEDERTKALSIFLIGVASGPILGPYLGGWITDNYSWRWIFFVNTPFGVIALILTAMFIHDPETHERLKKGDAIDWVGILLLTVGMGSLQIMLDKGQEYDWFGSNTIIALCIIAVVCLTFLVVWELNHELPITNLRLMLIPNYGLGCVLVFTGFFTYYGGLVLLPEFLQDLYGLSPTQAGEVTGLFGITLYVTILLVNRMYQFLDGRIIIIIGLLFLVFGFYNLSMQTPDSGYWDFALARAIMSTGLPLYYVGTSILTYAYVSNKQLTEATPMFNVVRNMGSSFGVAFATTVVARRSQYHQSVLVNFLTDGLPAYDRWIAHAKKLIFYKFGNVPELNYIAKALAYNELQFQSKLLAYFDAFFLMAMFFLIMMLFVIKLHDPRPQKNKEKSQPPSE